MSACASTIQVRASGLPADFQAGDEERLIQSLLADDTRAWREFNRQYAGLLYSRIHRVIQRFPQLGPEDAREIFAGFCLQLLANDKRKLRSFEVGRGTRLSSWLALLVSHAAYDYLRSLKREPCRVSATEAELLASSSPDPLQTTEARQRAAMVAELLGDLSPRDQEFMVLYYGEGMSPEDIARALGISVKTVYSKKHKIRARLESAATQNRLAA